MIVLVKVETKRIHTEIKRYLVEFTYIIYHLLDTSFAKCFIFQVMMTCHDISSTN